MRDLPSELKPHGELLDRAKELDGHYIPDIPILILRGRRWITIQNRKPTEPSRVRRKLSNSAETRCLKINLSEVLKELKIKTTQRLKVKSTEQRL